MRLMDGKRQEFSPGSVVEVCFPLFKHYAIASDRRVDRRPTLIGLSYRTGSVEEEPWRVAAGDREVRLSNIQGPLPGLLVVKRARACARRTDISWNLFTRNCEHFVRAAHGLPVESPQVRNAIGGAILGVAAVVVAPHATVVRMLLAAHCGAFARMRRFAQDGH